MHLKQITLQDFRCFDSLTIDLHERLTVLVAENAGGKTSVLDAIAKGLAAWFPYLDSAEQRLTELALDDDDLRVVPAVNNRGRQIAKLVDIAKLTLTMHFDDAVVAWDIAHVLNDSVLQLSLLRCEHGDTALKPRANKLRDAIHNGDDDIPIPVFAYYGIHRGHVTQEIPDRIHEPNVDYSRRLSALVDALSPNLRDFSEMIRWFKEAALDEYQWKEARAEGKLAPGENAERYEGALPHIRRAFQKVLDERVSEPRIDRDSKKFMVDFRADDGTVTPLRFDQLSQGYASVLALVMDLAQRLAVANPHFDASTEHDHREGVEEIFDPLSAPAIVLIDEVDLHLHPSWQQRVLGDLMRAFPHTQFIVTTHSPQVVSTVKPENIRILRRDEDGKWIADDKAPNTYGHSNSRSLEAVMGGRAYPEHLQTVADLREYQRLVGADQHDSPRALELRGALENVWGKNDPELQLVDVGIRKNEALRKVRAQQK
jgi:predicted ATP-binding protein involved in virulence